MPIISDDDSPVVITTTHKGVVSKSIVTLLDQSLINVAGSAPYWGDYYNDDRFRSVVIDYLQDLMGELLVTNKIYNFKVISDTRNNTPEQSKAGTFFIDIEYRQTNCINVTRLNYMFQYRELTIDYTFTLG